MSLPAGGVWIEIAPIGVISRITGRSPQGECGLKFPHGLLHGLAVPSLPARGVWIEILTMCWTRRMEKVAPRKGSVD